MFEETVSIFPAIWACVNSWCTPAVLFVLLNLMIGTIAVTSGFGSQNPQKKTKPTDPQPQPHLARSPSVLQRLKSINFYSYRSPEPTSQSHFSAASALTASAVKFPPEADTNFSLKQPPAPEENVPHDVEPPFDAEVDGFDEGTRQEEEEEQSMDEVFGKIQGKQLRTVTRVKSDTRPAAGEVPVKLPKKMRKSASVKSAFSHFEPKEVVESRRPATVREGNPPAAAAAEADHEVDAKADDFINRFRQQLQLQRLDSIMRYKEMLKRGSEK